MYGEIATVPLDIFRERFNLVTPTSWCDLDLTFDLAVVILTYISGGYFGLAFATPPPRVEIFYINALRGKRQQLSSPNLQDIFIKLLWEGK